MTLTPPSETIVRSDTELFALWRRLMGSGGFGIRTVWLLFFDADGRAQHVIVPIEGVPLGVDQRLVDAIGVIITDLIDRDGVASVALLLSRPGQSQLTDDDRCWARALTAISARWPVHLATTDRIQVFAWDDMLPDGGVDQRDAREAG
jgi:hypothetical protein